MSLKELIANIQELEEEKERLTKKLENCTSSTTLTGTIPPPPPPPPTGTKAPPATGTKAMKTKPKDLLADIRDGITLKKVPPTETKAMETKQPKDFLAEIREGKKLKKVTKEDKSKTKTAMSDAQKQIIERRRAIEPICDINNEEECNNDDRCYWTGYTEEELKAWGDDGPDGECNIRQTGGFDRYLMAFKK